MAEFGDRYHPGSIKEAKTAKSLLRVGASLNIVDFKLLESLTRKDKQIRGLFCKYDKSIHPSKKHPFNIGRVPWGNYSDPDDPYFIYDGGAADCTVIFSIDSRGGVLTFHDSLYANDDGGLRWLLGIYRQVANDLLDQDKVTVITGTNIQWLNDPGPAKDQFLGTVLDGLKDLDPQLLVTRQSKSQKIFSPIPSKIQRVEGVAILPKQLSLSGLTECFLFTDATTEEERSIREKYRVK